MVDVAAVIADLRAESAEVDALVAGLDDGGWRVGTPAAGWTVGHQVAHLAWTDQQSLKAIRDPEGFHAEMAAAFAEGNPQRFVDEGAEGNAARPDLLGWWRGVRDELADALAGWPEGRKIPWYGPPMSAASMATARIMETWAHGNDIADALGVRRVGTGRMRHIAHLGVRTRDFAYLVRGLTPPDAPFRVELVGPGGATWVWGPPDAGQRVFGWAEDFCRLVTQRVHRDDTGLVAVGEQAEEWLGIAQAFAGPPGPGRDRRSS